MNSEKFEFLVSDDEINTRLDVLLAEKFPQQSRSFYQKLIEDENILVNQKLCTSKKYKVAKGDVITGEIPKPKELKIIPEDIPLNIVYEDDDLLVIDKPAGMVVHPAAGNFTGTMVNAIMHHCKDRLSSINGEIRPGIVHRIDKDTSGLLVVAKNDETHRSLSAQLKEHSITRRYKAIVYNNFNEDSGTVDAPIGRDPNNRLKQAVLWEDFHEGKSGVRNAITHYEVCQRFGKFILIECQLETGRTHQIRIHMAYIKHPLLGDTVYGPEKNKYGANRQMLHAYLLGFIHPKTQEYIEFNSPLPEDFKKVLNKLEAENN